jgi:uncharacterized protein (TIGR00290 family)
MASPATHGPSALTKVVVSWSGGKDSALALHELRRRGDVEVAGLLTFVDDAADRVAHHRVPAGLVRRQADAAGVPLWEIRMPPDPPNAVYEARMAAAVARMRDESVTHCAFGDLFLADVRAYREGKLAGTGVAPLFPLWGRDTGALVRDFIRLGFRARIVCVDMQQIDGAFAGRELDESFLADLPPTADPCGENGEYHTFVHDGPIFSAPIACGEGELTATHDRFRLWLLPHP